MHAMSNKPKRSLFTDDERWTEECHILSEEARKALCPLIEHYIAKNYKTREIEMVIKDAIFDIMINHRLDLSDQ